MAPLEILDTGLEFQFLSWLHFVRCGLCVGQWGSSILWLTLFFFFLTITNQNIGMALHVVLILKCSFLSISEGGVGLRAK